MADKIKVVIKRPGEPAKVETISNTLETLQGIIGGYIESVTIFTDLVVLCDEDGRAKGLPHCMTFMGVDFCGPVIMAGIDGEEFGDAPVENLKVLFPFRPSLLYPEGWI